MPRVKLAHLSVDDLKKEISRRQRALSKLIAKRDALNCQISEQSRHGRLQDEGPNQENQFPRRAAASEWDAAPR
jgi:hypothetical protein